MVLGQVKWFDNRKGFGFLRCDECCDEDIFIHYSNIIEEGFKCLQDGEAVEFDLVNGDKGYHALNVRKTATPIPSPTPEDKRVPSLT